MAKSLVWIAIGGFGFPAPLLHCSPSLPGRAFGLRDSAQVRSDQISVAFVFVLLPSV